MTLLILSAALVAIATLLCIGFTRNHRWSNQELRDRRIESERIPPYLMEDGPLETDLQGRTALTETYVKQLYKDFDFSDTVSDVTVEEEEAFQHLSATKRP